MEMHAVILTKSDMYGDSCVTAYEPNMARFVRFVRDVGGSPIPKQISDGFDCLDMVSVNIIRPCPFPPQTENLLVDPNSFSVIQKYQPGIIGEVYRRALPLGFPRYMDNFSYNLASVAEYDHSLELIRVSELLVFVNEYDKVKANFEFNFQRRKFFSVTDPDAKRRAHAGGWYVGDAYVAVSIPKKPDDKTGKYFKFIAAIYPLSDF